MKASDTVEIREGCPYCKGAGGAGGALCKVCEGSGSRSRRVTLRELSRALAALEAEELAEARAGDTFGNR